MEPFPHKAGDWIRQFKRSPYSWGGEGALSLAFQAVSFDATRKHETASDVHCRRTFKGAWHNIFKYASGSGKDFRVASTVYNLTHFFPLTDLYVYTFNLHRHTQVFPTCEP